MFEFKTHMQDITMRLRIILTATRIQITTVQGTAYNKVLQEWSTTGNFYVSAMSTCIKHFTYGTRCC